MIEFVLIFNGQSEIRLLKWYKFLLAAEKKSAVQLAIRTVKLYAPLSNGIIDWSRGSLILRQYADLTIVFAVESSDNKLLAHEMIHFFATCLDRYFGGVSELDLIFNYLKAYHVLDEIIMNGRFCEASIKAIVRASTAHDQFELANIN